MAGNNVHFIFDYIKCVEELQKRKKDDEILLFRGHARKDYELKPSLFRDGNEKIRDNEAESLRRIEMAHPRELAGMSTLDKLAMLQHYEFPTRLLDFSFNPLVGLFFAVNSHKEEDGAVIIYRLAKDEIVQFDSNMAKALAELAVFPKELKYELSKCERTQLQLALSQFIPMGGCVAEIINDEEQLDEKLLDLARKIMCLMPPELNGELDLFTPIFVKTKLQ